MLLQHLKTYLKGSVNLSIAPYSMDYRFLLYMLPFNITFKSVYYMTTVSDLYDFCPNKDISRYIKNS